MTETPNTSTARDLSAQLDVEISSSEPMTESDWGELLLDSAKRADAALEEGLETATVSVEPPSWVDDLDEEEYLLWLNAYGPDGLGE